MSLYHVNSLFKNLQDLLLAFEIQPQTLSLASKVHLTLTSRYFFTLTFQAFPIYTQPFKLTDLLISSNMICSFIHSPLWAFPQTFSSFLLIRRWVTKKVIKIKCLSLPFVFFSMKNKIILWCKMNFWRLRKNIKFGANQN